MVSRFVSFQNSDQIIWPNGIIFHQPSFPWKDFPSKTLPFGGPGRFWSRTNLTRNHTKLFLLVLPKATQLGQPFLHVEPVEGRIQNVPIPRAHRQRHHNHCRDTHISFLDYFGQKKGGQTMSNRPISGVCKWKRIKSNDLVRTRSHQSKQPGTIPQRTSLCKNTSWSWGFRDQRYKMTCWHVRITSKSCRNTPPKS